MTSADPPPTDDTIPPLPPGLARGWAERLLGPDRPRRRSSLTPIGEAAELLERRQAAGLSRRQLAALIQVAQANLVLLEQGLMTVDELPPAEQWQLRSWLAERATETPKQISVPDSPPTRRPVGRRPRTGEKACRPSRQLLE